MNLRNTSTTVNLMGLESNGEKLTISTDVTELTDFDPTTDVWTAEQLRGVTCAYIRDWLDLDNLDYWPWEDHNTYSTAAGSMESVWLDVHTAESLGFLLDGTPLWYYQYSKDHPRAAAWLRTVGYIQGSKIQPGITPAGVIAYNAYEAEPEIPACYFRRVTVAATRALEADNDYWWWEDRQ